jgi:mannose-6-phosphate isomerase-like protein (cupin superfamily)
MGWASSSIDELGNETFRKVRRELGITAFGANVLVLQPGVTGRPHYHEEQDELYFVHEGRAIFDCPTTGSSSGRAACCTWSRRRPAESRIPGRTSS